MNVGILGTGLMGFPISVNILTKNNTVKQFYAWNRTKSKAEPLAEYGAIVVDNATEVIENSDVILIMLSQYEIIDLVLFESCSESLSLGNKTIIQMSTISSDQTLSLKDKLLNLNETNVFIECPVLGSASVAKEGQLQIMIGGTQEQHDQYSDLLLSTGKAIFYIGEVGKASTLKLALNTIISGQTAVFAQSLSIIENAGLDFDTYMKIVNDGPASCPYFNFKSKNMRTRNYEEVAFPAKLFLKDLNVIMSECEKFNITTDVLKGIQKTLEHTVESGLGEKDMSAIYNSINRQEQDE